MIHDLGPTPEELKRFTEGNQSPPMRVDVVFPLTIAAKMRVTGEKFHFTVPPGFQLDKFLYSWNTDCSVQVKTLEDENKDKVGLIVSLFKKKELILKAIGQHILPPKS